ncbi:uncharacterized protein [Panulirus ornatus]|uniref:uncharacterized protein isoform X2 n=1 Tax=Panulirus ornatus TaxID=150431 RepID=UPI003A86CDA8
MFEVSRGTLCRTAWGLFLLLYHTAALSDNGMNCDAPLGLADRRIPDSSIRSTVEGSTPGDARLNGEGAWCFKVPDDPTIKKVSITIDLGEAKLVSGVQTQGPPANMYDADYNYYVSFSVLTTRDDEWETCCKTFYANDKHTDTGVVMTHAFSSLILARSIRLSFKTDLRLDESDTKCFRLEVLGCPPEVEADSGIKMMADPSGWLVTTWEAPVVQVPMADGGMSTVSIPDAQYVVQIDRSKLELENEVVERRVKGYRFMLPSPMWKATYDISLVCIYPREELNVTCGSSSLEAIVYENDVSPGDDVLFRTPSNLKASVGEDSLVKLSWSTGSQGWITTFLFIQVLNKDDGSEVQRTKLTHEDTSTMLEVDAEHNYTVIFEPSIRDYWRDVSFSFDLYMIPWEDVALSPRRSGYGVFVAELGLTPYILWNGTLRLLFEPAIVRGEDADATTEAPEPTGSTTESPDAREFETNMLEEAEASILQLNESTSSETTETTETTGSSETTGRTAESSETTGSTAESSETTGSASGSSETTGSTSGSSETTGTTAGSSETTGSTTAAPDTTENAAGSSETTGSTTAAPDTTENAAGSSETTGNTAGSSETTGNTAESSGTTGSTTAAPETTENAAGSSETTGSTAGSSETTGSTAGSSETTGSTAGSSETTGTTAESSETTGSTTAAPETTSNTTGSFETTGRTTAGPETTGSTAGSSGVTQGSQDAPMSGARDEATVVMYTVLVTSEDGNWTATVDHTSDTRVDMPDLTLEKQYNITLICHFGNISIECGQAKTYTAAPLYSTYLDGELVIYTVAEERASWEQQEVQCRRAGGTVVSLSTEEEDLQVCDALAHSPYRTSLQAFWIGLKMCVGGSGTLWSDGSKWPGYRKVSDIRHLSTSTCCIKAVWDRDHPSWVGEMCNAILPALCEFHPEDILGRVTDLERGEADHGMAGVSWSYEKRAWTPTAFTITYCRHRDLRDLLPKFDNSSVEKMCNTTRLGMQMAYEKTGLEPFSEYAVKVWPSIHPMNYTGEPDAVHVRTYPKEPAMVTIDDCGYLYVMWAQKVAEFGEEDDVQLEIINTTHPTEPMHKGTIKAVGAKFHGFKIGQTYSVLVKEVGGRRRRENVTFPAYPTCECMECQVGDHCFLTTDRKVNALTASEDCKGDGRSLATVSSVEELVFLVELANTVEDDLWISQNSEILKVPDEADSAALLENELEEALDDGLETTNPLPDSNSLGPECLMVSRAMRAVVEEPCNKHHEIVCSYRVPVAVEKAFLNLTTNVGSTWISVTWDTTPVKWQVTYRVRYLRTKEVRYNAERLVVFASHPPVTLEQLLPDTSYTIDLKADYGDGYVSMYPEFPIFTTAGNETQPDPEELVLGSTPLGRDGVIQLVCNSVLVASCIATMLLFFATGMFYQDCVAQLGFQSTLLAAYLNLILAHPSQIHPENEIGCMVVAVVLHFLFMCAFMFLMLEALTIAHLLVIHIRSPFQKSNWLMMVVGFAVPLLIVGVSAGFVHSQYPDYVEANCWLNPLGAAVWTESVPNLILVIAIVFLLLNTVCTTTETSPELIAADLRGRQSDSHKLRWVVLALTVELSVAWATGVAFYQLREEALLFTFCAFTVILALTIICARTWFDDTFRTKMHRLCCGTELTYKRSEIFSFSAKSRVSPTTPSTSASSRFVSSEEQTSTETTSPSYSLPNTPSEDHLQHQVLVRRTYNFNEDEPVRYN